MLISKAFAQEVPVPAPAGETPTPNVTDGTITTTTTATGAPVTAPDTQGMLLQNVAMIVLLVVMFYFLLIRPQQKRFKEHKAMVDSLKVGDRVVTAGGLVGRIDTLSGGDEVTVDLGNGTKVTALRSMLSVKTDKPANDTAKK